MGSLLLAFNLLIGGDIATTHYGLTHGAHEMIIPSQNPWVVDAVLVSEAVGGSIALHHVGKQHQKLATWIAVAAIGVRGAVVAHNIAVLRK